MCDYERDINYFREVSMGSLENPVLFCSAGISTLPNSIKLFICSVNSEVVISQSIKRRSNQNQTAHSTKRGMDYEHHHGFLSSLLASSSDPKLSDINIRSLLAKLLKEIKAFVLASMG